MMKRSLQRRLKLGLWVLMPLVLLTGGCERPLSSVEMLQRGIMLAQREQLPEALEYFNRAIQADAQNADTYYERAVVHARTGKTDLALLDYSEAIQLNDQFVQAFNNRGQLYAGRGQHDQAIRDFSRAIQIEPRFSDAYQQRGISRQERQQYADAISDFEMAIDLEPTALRHHLRAKLLCGQARYDEAISDFDAALALDASLAKAWLGRAIAMYKQGDLQAAQENLNQAALLDTAIVSDDILSTLQGIGSGTFLSDADLTEIRRTLVELGWQTETRDGETFPLAITKTDSRSGAPVRRLVCVASLDPIHQGILLPTDRCAEVLQESQPKSLMLATTDQQGKRTWRWIEDWSPNRSQMQSVQVRISLPAESLDTLAQASPR